MLWAHRWFTGPVRQIEAEKLGVDPMDVAAVERAEEEGKFATPPEKVE